MRRASSWPVAGDENPAFLDQQLAEISPEALQYRTFEVVIELAGRLAADGPLVPAM